MEYSISVIHVKKQWYLNDIELIDILLNIDCIKVLVMVHCNDNVVVVLQSW